MRSSSSNKKIQRLDTPAVANSCREWFATGAGTVFLLFLYGAFPEKIYVFDGILFSGIIERIGANWRADLFNGRHLLFNPSMMFLRDLAVRVGLTLSAYSLIQLVNAVAGTLGVLLFARFINRLTRDKVLAFTFALLLAVSCNYWDRATEGQVYMLMTLGALATAYGALSFTQDATPASGLMLCAAFIAAVLFHSVNIMLLPMVLFALWAGSSKAAKSTVWGAAALIMAGVTLPFLIAFNIWSSESLRAFFAKTLELYSAGKTQSGPGLIERIYSSEPLNLFARLSADANALYSALVAHSPMGGLGAAVICSAVAYATYVALRRTQERRPIILVALFGVGYALINSFWHGGEFFWSPPLAAALALVAAAAAPRLEQTSPKRRREVLGGVGALAIALGGWNFKTDIQPRALLSNNLSYRSSVFVGEHAVPFSWVIISGISDSNLKSYLPYFAHRNREVIEYYFNNQPKAAGLDQLRHFIQQKIQYGIPLYMLPDLVQDKSTDDILRRWGVSPAELHGCFGPGHMVLVSQNSDLRLFLFIPRDQTELLFANLLFQALTADQRHSEEVTGDLKNIARFELPPARLRSAVDLAEHSDYGARLLWEGIFKDLNPTARSKAENDIKGFDAWQKTPEFFLRLGGLYRSIGLDGDARRKWTEGYRLTHDVRLRDAAHAG